MSQPPFRVPNPFRDPVRRTALDIARPAIERALGFTTLNTLYEQANRAQGSTFAARALDTLGIRYVADPAAVEGLEVAGPLIVVANHPFGGVDGLILADLITRARADVRILANELLARIPDIRDLLIPIDPFGNRSSARRNGSALRAAIRWIASGGALVVFPAGEVAHASWRDWVVTDPVWTPTVGHLVRRTRATVVPVHVSGSNSSLFQMAGLVHARLRTAMLPREMLKQQGRTIVVQVGSAIPWERFGERTTAGEVTSYLRLRTSALAGRNPPGLARIAVAEDAFEPIAPAVAPERLAADVAALSPDRCLVSASDYEVWIGEAGELPAVVEEIGRLREAAFRRVGEGTGRARDLDRFDADYLHLFLWNREGREIVGSYRLGPTDRILGRTGADGLYTSTLFRETGRLAAELTPALELGRSFVRPEYQRQYTALMLLWKGIGAFVARHPRYRRLFGNVSISQDYRPISKHLLMAYLTATRLDDRLARLVRPRNPPRVERPADWAQIASNPALTDLEEIDRLIAEIEEDRKGVPVLLRHYLKLGARLLGFNVDRNFGDVLDGLMVVYLTAVPAAVLTRYMGADAAASFLAAHAGLDGAGATTAVAAS